MSESFEAETIEQFEVELRKAVDLMKCLEPLKKAVSYALFPGGKRIRPLFALSLCRDLGGDFEKLLPATCALEFAHCASLVHDDLPELDNDDIRRGRPSCHKAFNPGVALLAGDFMVPQALYLLATSSFPARDRLELVKALSAAFTDLCNGQTLDILPDNERGDMGLIHQLKTGALFKTACRFAAVSAGLSDKASTLCEELGLLAGVGFQIVDDYIDRFGTDQERGRPASSDSRNKKRTYFNGQSKSEGQGALTNLQHKIDDCLRNLGTELAQTECFTGSFEKTRYVLNRIFSRVPSA
jgi:geranylgeranyl diphosphate synthase, type II